MDVHVRLNQTHQVNLERGVMKMLPMVIPMDCNNILCISYYVCNLISGGCSACMM